MIQDYSRLFNIGWNWPLFTCGGQFKCSGEAGEPVRFHATKHTPPSSGKNLLVSRASATDAPKRSRSLLTAVPGTCTHQWRGGRSLWIFRRCSTTSKTGWKRHKMLAIPTRSFVWSGDWTKVIDEFWCFVEYYQSIWIKIMMKIIWKYLKMRDFMKFWRLRILMDFLLGSFCPALSNEDLVVKVPIDTAENRTFNVWDWKMRQWSPGWRIELIAT